MPHVRARETGAVLWPTASQPWEDDRSHQCPIQPAKRATSIWRASLLRRTAWVLEDPPCRPLRGLDGVKSSVFGPTAFAVGYMIAPASRAFEDAAILKSALIGRVPVRQRAKGATSSLYLSLGEPEVFNFTSATPWGAVAHGPTRLLIS